MTHDVIISGACPVELNETQLDALKEVGNIGAGHAATALAHLTGCKITMTVPRVQLVPLGQVADLVGGDEALVAAALQHFGGEAQGSILVVLSEPNARRLIWMITSDEALLAQPLHAQAERLRHSVGVLIVSYLSALSRFVGRRLEPSETHVAVDMAGAIIDAVLAEISQEADMALVIETEFRAPDPAGEQVAGHMLLLPSLDSLKLILAALGVD